MLQHPSDWNVRNAVRDPQDIVGSSGMHETLHHFGEVAKLVGHGIAIVGWSGSGNRTGII